MADVRRETCLTDTFLYAPPVERTIAELAAVQWGVVARRQLTAAGVTPTMIQSRVRSGHLLRLHRGVYAVGHQRLRREGYWHAAVLAIGPEAVLSHRDAAALHAIRPSNGPKVDVTTAGRPAEHPGIRVHHARRLDPRDTTTVEGIPVTTVARTLVDLAAVVSPERLARAVSEAERLRLLDVDALDAARHRTRGRRGPGHGRLANAIAELEAHGTTLTRSSLEAAFLDLTDGAGLPRPRMNAYVEGIEVDALWPVQRLVVELDGYAFHRGRRAFQHDRDRDAALLLAGYAVLRLTHHDVTRRPALVATRIRRVLASPRAAPI